MVPRICSSILCGTMEIVKVVPSGTYAVLIPLDLSCSGKIKPNLKYTRDVSLLLKQ